MELNSEYYLIYYTCSYFRVWDRFFPFFGLKSQNNPRFLRIYLHTFRHFYATETLRRTNNLSYVKYALGHKTIINTEKFTHLTDIENTKYYSAVATTLQEDRKLAEDGWTYFQEFEGAKVFRKPIGNT